MKKQILILVIVSLHGTGSLYAQRYLNLSVDNDLFFGRDRYYSSGIFINSGKLNKNSDTLINYSHWTLGHEIYTPSLRYTKDVEYYDYPYGGWLFFQWAVERPRGHRPSFAHRLRPPFAWRLAQRLFRAARLHLRL